MKCMNPVWSDLVLRSFMCRSEGKRLMPSNGAQGCTELWSNYGMQGPPWSFYAIPHRPISMCPYACPEQHGGGRIVCLHAVLIEGEHLILNCSPLSKG